MTRLLYALIGCLLLALAGCGGGGSGSGGGTTSTVSGTASKGLIRNGTVTIYALNPDGTQGGQLATADTDSNGHYSATLTNYSGPILAVAYGSYVDEATGQTVTLTAANPLRAALPSASGTVSLPITGLTELAVRQAGTLTPAHITDANAVISSVFKVDILATSPVDATPSALGAAGVTAGQRDYTLALAALSQLASTSSGGTPGQKLEAALATISQGITSSNISSQTASTFVNALDSYLSTNGGVNDVVTSHGGSALVSVGSRRAVLTVAVSGAGPGINGAEFNMSFPAGVTVKSQSDGLTDNCVLGATAGTSGALLAGSFTAASGSTPGVLRVVLVSATPVIDGTILVINADVADGLTPAMADFPISFVSVVGADGAPVNGATVAVTGVSVQ
ncbi:hypothetical protein L4X63_16875 [Geomonas sp. Red32]|uniref:hypothetical protein n=1 Tax=Geomonas sp. Red32 TaxID=2912856 RepID=UPI00202CA9AA|nr:hypothetical protein [Geomonas sp. Red32]MCM0083261.1 hypothetical protein [Geomonas sp. Red32]